MKRRGAGDAGAGALEAITRKGSQSVAEGDQRPGPAQLRQGEHNRQRTQRSPRSMRISARKVDRVKPLRRGRHGGGPGRPAGSASSLRKADGAFEAHLVALSCSEGARAMVAAAPGGPRRGTRLYRQRLARDGAAVLKKTSSSRGDASAG